MSFTECYSAKLREITLSLGGLGLFGGASRIFATQTAIESTRRRRRYHAEDSENRPRPSEHVKRAEKHNGRAVHQDVKCL